MSSFKRAIKSTNDSSSKQAQSNEVVLPVTGIKPWIHNGIGIVSSGNKQLDDLIGGGIVLGTVTCIEIDHLTTYGESLISYYISESISHQQNILIINENESSASKVIESLPYNKTIGSGSNDSNQDVCIDKNVYTIAWKNGKNFDIKIGADMNRNDFNPPVYCCSYDLSRRIQSNLLLHANIEFCSLVREVAEDNLLSYILKSIKIFLMNCINTNNKSVNRIYLPLDQIIMQYIRIENKSNVNYTSEISKFVLQIKHMIRDTRTSVLVTIRPQLTSSSYMITKLRYISDNLLTIESFAGRTHSIPYEFKDFHGFLLIQKLQNYGTLASYRPSGTRFGIKRNRHKLNIEPLHLPPEENRTFAGTGGNSLTDNSINNQSTLGLTKNNKNDDMQHHDHNHNHNHGNSNNTNYNIIRSSTLTSLVNNKTNLLDVEAMNTIMKIDVSHNETTTNPYKISLSEKLAAIKAARLHNNTNDSFSSLTKPIIDEGNLPLSSNMCGSQKYDF